MMAFVRTTGVLNSATRLHKAVKCFHVNEIITRSFSSTYSLRHKDDVDSKSEEKPKQSKDFKESLLNPNMSRPKTPIRKLDEIKSGIHPYAEKEPLQPWPENTNPNTGEVGGPKGPEPTRYGDWERKGKVSDF